ncbi:MAG: amino acid adenylation domain-containing protein [Candidatus Polarisedimenticolia bacterium]
MKDLTERLAALSPEQRALLDARLRARGISAPRPVAIRPIPDRGKLPWFPTSLDQERLWFVDQMEPGNPAYNIHTSTRLQGPMDAALMRRAVNAAIARHEVLRTTIRAVDGRPVQVVAPSLEIDVPVLDLSGLPASEREAAGQRAAVEAAAVRFEMDRGPLIRVGLVRLDHEDHILTICMQHAITDRWSFDVFEAEITQTYLALRDGRTVEFPPLPIQFADFAAWQREELSGERLESHLQYWRSRLAGAPMVLEIPTDRPRPPVQTFNGARAYIVYPEELLGALKELTQRSGATMFMTMLAALSVLCWKYARQRDLVIGSAIADRNRPETENVLGYFLNMLLLRATIDPAMTFRQLLHQARDTALGAYAHQDVPFATLVSELRPAQDPSRNPLIQMSYIYLDFPVMMSPESAGFSAGSLDVDNGASRFDMTLACTELPGTGIHSYIEYNSDLYDRSKVERMLRHLGRILEAMAADPDRPLSDLQLLVSDEAQRLSAPLPPPHLSPGGGLLHEGIAAAAKAAPDAPALVLDGVTVPHGELNEAASRVAGRLRCMGIGPGDLVPVCAARSLEQVAALLGVLQAGAAYVPLDPALPAARLRGMLAGTAARVVLAQRGTDDLLGEAAGTTLLEIEAILQESGPVAGVPEGGAPSPDDLAYVMFTSGSTGSPKGVMVPHRAIANRVAWAQGRFPISPGDRVLHNASFGFDIAAWELFGPLRAGATVVMPPEGEHKDPAALVRLLREQRVTIAHFVPSVLRAVLEEPALASCETLRTVFCGGEEMDRALHDRFFDRLPGRTLAHFYGPTEAAISCLCHVCSPHEGPGPVRLGRPIDHLRVAILDDTLQLVPPGVPGEIHIGGEGLARGYLGRPDLTADRFIPDPGGGEGKRLYRTGDRARYRPDGALEFLGRFDHQIKLRGHRIEPGEIESVLERVPGVSRALAAVRGAGAGQRLVAYVAASGAPPDEAEMRTALRRALPEPMMPSAFVMLDTFPLGPNGKVDRAALPEPGAPTLSSAFIAPRTPAETIIAGIWSELLRRDPIGVETSFFDLGGDSLLATQVVSRVRGAFDVDLPLRRFFEGATVGALAGIVEELLVARLDSMTDDEAARRLEMAPAAPRAE